VEAVLAKAVVVVHPKNDISTLFLSKDKTWFFLSFEKFILP